MFTLASMRDPAPTRLKTITVACLLLGVLAAQQPALALDDGPDDWLGPGQNDVELRGSIGFSHLFDFGLSDLSVQLDFGYFFLDSLEGGLGGSLGFSGKSGFEAPSDSDLPNTSGGVGTLEQALTVGALARRQGGWHGTTNLWLRFFPFEVPDEAILPRVFAPFVELEFGPHYAEDVTPYLLWTTWLGANLYITEQLALSPRVGYALILITDDDARTDDAALEHAIVTSLGFSVFLTP